MRRRFASRCCANTQLHLDEYRLLVQPVVMGTGKRFFTDELPAMRLKLVESQPLSLGVMALTHQPDRMPIGS